jgi:hypothetical protein
MSEQTKPITADELNKLVVQFHAIKSHDEQCRFYHDNPALHSVIRGVLFPKPEDSKPE